MAIFIALGGSAVAANLSDERDSGRVAAKKKKKPRPGPPGPAGPQGLQGVQGIQGSQGPPGPTFADIIGGVGTVTAEQFSGSNSVTPPVAGRLLVMAAYDSVNVTCNTPANIDVGLYVGSTPVAGTFRTIPHMTNTRYEGYGVSNPVSAGVAQAVQLGAACQGAPTVSTITTPAQNFTLGAVLLGS